jgi:hypothetical protein
VTRSRNILAPRHRWTAVEIDVVRQTFAYAPTRIIAKVLGLTEALVSRKAHQLGLKKSPVYLASPLAHRLFRDSGHAHRFQKGQVPANKGLRRPGWAPGRMATTQFKKGQRSVGWMPIGAERINGDGYRDRKVSDTGYGPRDWVCVHRLLWIERNGPIPHGHCLVFVNGDKTDIRIENVACITQRENMLRNSIHRLPEELVQVVMLKGRLQRQINKREGKHREKRNRGSSQSPVCDAGGVAGQGHADGA